MNYPVILLGHNKIGGLINNKIFNKIKNVNFINVDLEDIDVNKLQKDLMKLNAKLDNYKFRDIIINNYGIKKIDKYIEIINNCKSRKINCLDECYSQILNIDNKKQYFYSSIEIYNILKSNIGQFTCNPNLKTIINLFDKKECLNLSNKLYELEIFENNINKKVEQIEKNVDLFRKDFTKLSIKSIIKKDFNKWILKTKSKWRK